MAETICMRVGENERIDIDDFVSALQNFLGILRDVDSAIAAKSKGNLLWRITTLKKDPLPVVGVTGYLRKAVEDISRRVEREIFRNIDTLNENGERNKFFPDAALSKVGRIAKSTQKIGSSLIYIDAPELESQKSTSITGKTLDQFKDLFDVKSTSYGVVFGQLGSISIHNGNEFRVWDEDTNKPVLCDFKIDEEEKMKGLLRQRVMVAGMVNSNRHGFPLSVKHIESVEPADKGDLPSIEEMAGLVPDFTGGVPLKEFLEELD